MIKCRSVLESLFPAVVSRGGDSEAVRLPKYHGTKVDRSRSHFEKVMSECNDSGRALLLSVRTVEKSNRVAHPSRLRGPHTKYKA